MKTMLKAKHTMIQKPLATSKCRFFLLNERRLYSLFKYVSLFIQKDKNLLVLAAIKIANIKNEKQEAETKVMKILLNLHALFGTKYVNK